MKLRYLTFTLFAFALCASPVAAQSFSSGEQALREFRSVYNQNDSNALRQFIVAYSEPGTDIETELGYWSGVYREVGSLSFVATSFEGPPGRENEIFWHLGDITEAWIGLRLNLTEEGQISGRGVARGVRPSVAPIPKVINASDLPHRLESYIARICDQDYFSGTVIVAKNASLIFEGACGFADRETERNNEVSTPFRLASVSKLFTGVAIAQLVESGRLTFDDPISQYIPEYPSHIGDQVTVRHLLTHTSGIELDDNADFNAAVGEASSVEDLLAVQLEYIEQMNSGNYEDFAPLTRFDYTNEGIDLLGVIIERVSGQTWSDYLQTHIFGPTEMASSGADFLEPVPDLARSYTTRPSADGTFQELGERRPVAETESALAWKIRPAGSAYSSAPDMLRFLRSLQTCEILNCELVDEITSAAVEIPVPPGIEESRAYGYTFGIDDSAKGVRAIGHRGGAIGQSTVVQYYPDLGYTVIILSNYDRTQWWLNMRIQEMIGAQ